MQRTNRDPTLVLTYIVRIGLKSVNHKERVVCLYRPLPALAQGVMLLIIEQMSVPKTKKLARSIPQGGCGKNGRLNQALRYTNCFAADILRVNKLPDDLNSLHLGLLESEASNNKLAGDDGVLDVPVDVLVRAAFFPLFA